MKYTERVHAKRLLKMLERKDPCQNTCPASKYFNFCNSFLRVQSKEINFCDICMSFVGVEAFLRDPSKEINFCCICMSFVGAEDCPCLDFGEQEAIKRTWLALEEKGYL